MTITTVYIRVSHDDTTRTLDVQDETLPDAIVTLDGVYVIEDRERRVYRPANVFRAPAWQTPWPPAASS